MSPTTGPPTGGTVVEVTGGSGYTDSTTVTMCGVTVAGHASTGGTTLTFATPALPNPYVCSQGLASVTTNNPSTPGLPAFTMMPEAFDEAGAAVGLATVLGYAIGALLTLV